MRRWLAAGALAGLLLAGGGAAADDWKGTVSAETWQFPEDRAYHDQERATYSIAGQVEYRADLADDLRFATEPFFRWDEADSQRTHADLRRMVLLWFTEDFDLRFGVDRVFWGVTESRHLVDFINQTDLVEDPDEEERLGQPMLRVTVPQEWGTLDGFILPYFRERTFPGRHGRLRPPPVIDTDRTQYESDAGPWHVDGALRYSHQFGPLDLGVAWFHGTSREPDLVPRAAGAEVVLVPVYPQVDQASLDAQVTTGPWLLKLEALGRFGQADLSGDETPYAAAVGGFEYTFFDAFGTGADLGALAEILYDSRGHDATTPYEGDLFGGLRLALNDEGSSEALVGVIQDWNSVSTHVSLEARTRIAENWTVAFDLRAFIAEDEQDLLFLVRRDDYLRLTVNYNF